MRGLVGIFLLGVLSINTGLTTAQQSCSVLVRQAIQAIGDNCSQLGRNVVCYGNDQVRATFLEEVAEDVFTRPADTARLLTSQQLQLRRSHLMMLHGAWQ
jgi:hypothetical protein